MHESEKSEVSQSCLTRSDLMDCSLLGSSARGIFQVRVLEWDAIAFSAITWLIAYKKLKKTTLIRELFFKPTPILVTFPGTCMRLNTFEEMVAQIVSKF